MAGEAVVCSGVAACYAGRQRYDQKESGVIVKRKQ